MRAPAMPARDRPPSRSQRPADHVHAVRLDDVVPLDIIVIGDLDAALVAFPDFAHVVFEAFERGDLALVDLAAFAEQARLRRPLDDALGDEAAGHDADLGYLEDLTDGGAAEVDF